MSAAGGGDMARDAWYLFHHAVKRFDYDEVTRMMRNGVDTRVRNPANGDTVMHALCRKNSHRLLGEEYHDGKRVPCWFSRMIMLLRPDPNATNNDGDTALHIACRNGDDDLARSLVSYGAGVNVVNKAGDTPAHAAIPVRMGWASRDRKNILLFLLAQCEFVDFPNAYGTYITTALSVSESGREILARVSEYMKYPPGARGDKYTLRF